MKTALCLGIVLFASTTTIMVDGITQAAAIDTWEKCTSLRDVDIPATSIALPTGGAMVTDATLVPIGVPNPFGEYCLVNGEISPADSQAQKIKFSVVFPSRWNGKIVHLGGGGFNGQVTSPSGTNNPVIAPPSLIERGYVSFASDSGHASASNTDASFALNEEQLRNFAGEQLKKTHDAVMFLVRMRYQVTPLHSYFLGGSEGGREAFTVIQQYPDDYDGVVALEPAHAMTADLLKGQIVRRAVRLNRGTGWISNAKAEFLRKTQLGACDKLDGIEDSIISNVEGCEVDFNKMRCPGGNDTGVECFSDPQLTTLRLMHSPTPLPYALSSGEVNLPAYEIGTDWGSPTVGAGPSDSPSPVQLVADSFVRFFVMRGVEGGTLEFDPLKPGRFLARVQELSDLLDRTSTNIDRFIARGGKWILIHGRSDEAVPPATSINYYQRLVARYGQARTDRFLRFYLVPGYGHGRGFSFNANGAPSLEALEDWVERGVRPEALTVVDANPEGQGRSRPLCVYPAWPKYNGIGDKNVANSFSCVRNR